MGAAQDAVDAAVTAITNATTVEASAVALINQIVAAALANKTDPAALTAAMAAFKQNTDDLSAAVVANTPAAPPTP